MFKVKVAYIKNPITNWIFVTNGAGTSFGHGRSEKEAKLNAMSYIEKLNRTICKDKKIELVFVEVRDLHEPNK